MMDDPWSRPTVDELRRVLESIGRAAEGNQRQTERLELSVSAEVTTSRGNTVAAMTVVAEGAESAENEICMDDCCAGLRAECTTLV
ncbi:MAG TPA: hypothetical protein EYP14_12940, partial [Planctomycetaceae bacterium]|nr:hypothetical protein [Planctomycetaceae bacterium]